VSSSTSRASEWPVEPVLPLPAGLGGASQVTVLWRPGCPYCALLLRGLDRAGLAYNRLNIWDHPDAAAWLRTVTGGDETVPTVHVRAAVDAAVDAAGDAAGAVALVNPSTADVLEAVARIAPQARAEVRAGLRPAPRGWRWLRGRRGRGHAPGAPR